MTITAGDFRATIELRDSRRFNAVVESDTYEDAFTESDLQEARRAVDSNAIEEFLRLSAPLDCRAHLVVESEPSQVGVSWVRSEDAFLKDSEDQGWWHFAVTISGPGRAPVLIILDSGTNPRSMSRHYGTWPGRRCYGAVRDVRNEARGRPIGGHGSLTSVRSYRRLLWSNQWTTSA